MLRKLFQTSKQDQELKYIEKIIDEVKNYSPCEASMLTLMRSVGKNWVPTDPSICKPIFKQHTKLVDTLYSKDFPAKYASIYPQFIKCVNAKFTAQAIDEFGQSQLENDSTMAAKAIEVSNETMKHLMSKQNPFVAFKSKKQISSGEEMAENLRQFRQFHFRCRSEGPEESRAEANEHIHAIKSMGIKKRR